jgi:hypothetical protein
MALVFTHVVCLEHVGDVKFSTVSATGTWSNLNVYFPFPLVLDGTLVMMLAPFSATILLNHKSPKAVLMPGMGPAPRSRGRMRTFLLLQECR